MIFRKHLALLSYLTVCIVWGSTYLCIRIGVTDMPFLLFSGIRFTTAGVIIMLISRLCGWALPKSRKDLRTLVFVGLLLLFVSNGLISWAGQWLESSMMALLIAATPLFMAAVENLLPNGNITGKLGWCGLFVGFGGVAALVGPEFSMSGPTFPAMLAVLTASLVWAIGSIYLRRHTISGSIMPAVGIQMLAAGIAFLLSAAASGSFSLAEASPKGFAAMLYLVIFGSIIGYSAFSYMIKALPAAKAGTYAYINPVVAMILGVLILRENVTAGTIVGAAVILGGVILVQLSKVSPVGESATPLDQETPAPSVDAATSGM